MAVFERGFSLGDRRELMSMVDAFSSFHFWSRSCPSPSLPAFAPSSRINHFAILRMGSSDAAIGTRQMDGRKKEGESKTDTT